MVEERENRMGVMPVGKLLFSMSTPMVISFLAFAIFGAIVTKAFFDAQTNSESIRSLGYSYLSIVTIFSFGLIL